MQVSVFLWALTALSATVYCLEPSAELEIRNKLALYALAVDSKEFNLLEQIFTTDVFADFVGQTYDGLPALKRFLKVSVENKTIQHAISTIVVQDDSSISASCITPSSVSYVIATFLGQGDQAGTNLALYGKYLDSWVHETQGAWMIKRRIFTLFPPGSIGNLAIMTS